MHAPHHQIPNCLMFSTEAMPSEWRQEDPETHKKGGRGVGGAIREKKTEGGESHSESPEKSYFHRNY